MNACMKIGIGKAGKITYTKFQEGVTPISDLWLKPETIAEYLLHIPPDRKIDIISMCQNSAGRLHHDSSNQDYHSSKMQHTLLSSLRKAAIPIFAPLSPVLYFPLEHLHLTNSSWMIVSKKTVEVVKLHTCHQANNKEAAIFATNVNCSFKWPTSCCSAAKWQPRICMYSVLHLPINCELTEQGECYSHIRLTFPMSKTNPTIGCQLCKQWFLGVKTPGVSI